MPFWSCKFNFAISFKFLLARLWFMVPLLLYGPVVFQKAKNIRTFAWLYVIGMMIAIAYTLVVHASYGFGEKEGHWVMWPFFKDHTSYGAILALIIPINVWLLYESEKNYFRILKISPPYKSNMSF